MCDAMTHMWLFCHICIIVYPLIYSTDEYMHYWTVSSFPQVMTCRLFDTKQLSEPMFIRCQLDPFGPTRSRNDMPLSFSGMHLKMSFAICPGIMLWFQYLKYIFYPDFSLISVLCYQPDPDRSFWIDLVPKGWMRRLKTLWDVTTKSANHDVIDICGWGKRNDRTMVVVVIVFMQ